MTDKSYIQQNKEEKEEIFNIYDKNWDYDKWCDNNIITPLL